MHLNLLPTHEPMETLFEVQDNTIDIDTEMLVLDNEPFNPYTKANYDPPEKEYSLDADGHFIIYDIDEEETPYSSNRTTFVHTESDESKIWLAQPANKVKKTWYNHIVKTELSGYHADTPITIKAEAIP